MAAFFKPRLFLTAFSNTPRLASRLPQQFSAFPRTHSFSTTSKEATSKEVEERDTTMLIRPDQMTADFKESMILQDVRGLDVTKENLLDDVIPFSNLSPEEQADMERVASFMCANSKQIQQRKTAHLVEKYQRFPGDTGSTEVQVAVLSEKITHLRNHMESHKKDMGTKYGLNKLFHRRRKLMKYLKKHRFEMYQQVAKDFDISEKEIWEFGHIPGRKKYITREKGMFEYKEHTKIRLEKESRLKKATSWNV
jgi:small subunit ribosomal protein S15